MLITIALLCSYIILNVYIYKVLSSNFKNKNAKLVHLWSAVAVMLFFVYGIVARYYDFTPFLRNYAFGTLLTVLISEVVLVLFFLIEDLYRLLRLAHIKLFIKKPKPTMPSRRKFVTRLALGVAAIPFSGLIYGILQGRYNFKVFRYKLYFEDLPAAFDGYRITQLSDIHTGSLESKEQFSYAIDLANQQESDVILFTGDLINDKTKEALPWLEDLSRLKAKDGVFSVLGNHDYGAHYSWPSIEDQKENLEHLKRLQKEIGFELLLNESRYLTRDGDRLALIGVENWGYGSHYPKKANLKNALREVNQDDFKILMSHDPTHWQYKVLKHPYHYHLTLSGHTHGMQMGVEIPGIVKWSPYKSILGYKYWAGMYVVDGQYLNVNRGLGTIGYPGRVGIWPEITVIELMKGKPGLDAL